MGSKPWLTLGALALSSLIVGCTNGPQKDAKVLGATNGNPPSFNANGPATPFPRADANTIGGQPKAGALPPFGPMTNTGPTGGPSPGPFVPAGSGNLPPNHSFAPIDRGNPSLPAPGGFNGGPNFAPSGVTPPVNPGVNNLRPLNSGTGVPSDGGFGTLRPGVPGPIEMK